jgi:GT2 family glycosyltransferase
VGLQGLMTARVSSDSKKTDETAAPLPDATVESVVVASIDFARVLDKRLLIYGWVLGFTKLVEYASVELDGVVVELAKNALPVPRPDVARHFSLDPADDQHGFYALVDLPAKIARVEDLKLSVTLSSGQSADSRWPVSCSESLATLEMGPYDAAALRTLLPKLPKREARRLVELVGPVLGLLREADYLSSLPPPIRFGIDLCCILEDRFFLVAGSLFDPAREVSSAEVCVGRSVIPFLKNAHSIARPDVNPEPSYYRKPGTIQEGFVFVETIPPEDAEANEARFHFTVTAETVRLTQAIVNTSQDARRDFLAVVNKLEAGSALALIEHLAAFLEKYPEQRSLASLLELTRCSTIERLAPSVQHTYPRYSLHVDRAIPVADEGLFLIGWFDVEAGKSVRIVCHRGASSFVVSDNWSRHARLDVKSHLESKGVQSEAEHGFACFIPLRSGDGPCYLSATLDSGETQHMRVPIEAKAESALQTVRVLLSTFSSTHPNLGFLLDHHVGPAVSTAWAARSQPRRQLTVRNYGNPPDNPALSIIVPLYGRFDFAEYQIALFADDPDFQNLELIYVVDDPAILAEFAGTCPDHYGMYRVPFVLATCRANLGFAGANNLGVEVAHAEHLLFMNSDVMPRRHGWTGDLLRIYKSLPAPGLLGTKLLYEDGSVQHAGIAFRRYSGWTNLWINDHPLKGQSPLGLTGVREVDTVTAACAMMEAALYRKLGGFCEDYIVGDFEDSDLCFRVSAAGRRNYVALDVDLYHLERQSQNRMGDSNQRANLTLYNCWLHNQRWAKTIEAGVSQTPLSLTLQSPDSGKRV